ncbi:hypothetical protein GGS23DRAFT_273540 [Durotheca rogersii]|uniref:uncharacterized protein n=1 Tax=Durotheca rogersii TaxID=419775 RepID=UPI00221E7A6B|nr:uncharacterized protein GGS23DRAFT_273540 [Durotheca rogersii]KAI5866488.1 hypothetical protein GGS23DRAFT_273540 [Durotheca rogersii]
MKAGFSAAPSIFRKRAKLQGEFLRFTTSTESAGTLTKVIENAEGTSVDSLAGKAWTERWPNLRRQTHYQSRRYQLREVYDRATRSVSNIKSRTEAFYYLPLDCEFQDSPKYSS